MRSHRYSGVMPRVVDHEQRRREIAYGVLVVVAQGGIAAVSLRSVAKAAGVSMGRVQHYFASKDELVQHACRVVAQVAGEAFEAGAGQPVRERLSQLLTLGFPGSEQARVGTSVWYSFVTSAATDPQLAQLVDEGWAGMRAELTALLTQARAAGELSPAVPADLRPTVLALAALQDGLVLRLMLGAITPQEAHAVVELELDRLVTMG